MLLEDRGMLRPAVSVYRCVGILHPRSKGLQSIWPCNTNPQRSRSRLFALSQSLEQDRNCKVGTPQKTIRTRSRLIQASRCATQSDQKMVFPSPVLHCLF